MNESYNKILKNELLVIVNENKSKENEEKKLKIKDLLITESTFSENDKNINIIKSIIMIFIWCWYFILIH